VTSPPGLGELAARARRLVALGGRRILGVTGPPGAGKSYLAAALAARVGAEQLGAEQLGAERVRAEIVSMDGYHLPDDELRRLNRLDRKGAPDTFDADAFIAMLRQLRTADDPLWAPAFDRHRELTIPHAIMIPATTELVIVEGNYLLLDAEPWNEARALLDEVWFIDHPDRIARLVGRHVEFGWQRDAALERATTGSDGENARLVLSTMHRADLVLEHGWLCS
jgi:pantothenate kinase